MSATQSSRLGIVVIGRNEGARLHRCLDSIASSRECCVYVDSDSSDDSVAVANQRGFDVIQLDDRSPLSAARARNVGYRRLLERIEGLRYVQFIDGDCEMQPDWLAAAAEFLTGNRDVAAVCGRLKEKFADRSVYTLLCDIEWDGPIGEIRACGGNALMRVDALRDACGFRQDLIAGEEPELCYRLRAAGWKIWRIDRAMAEHDAAITRFGQWWLRMVRAGHAYAEGAFLHGAEPERYRVRECASAWLWGLVLPITTIVLATAWSPLGWGLLAVYPSQVARLAMRGGRARWRYAFFTVLGKFALLAGNLRFLGQFRSRHGGHIVEYK